jgi:tryptophan synthase beta chain
MEAEGWLPAPESAYSVCCAIEEAIKCKESGEKKAIAFNISGHGFLDISGYRNVLGLE